MYDMFSQKQHKRYIFWRLLNDKKNLTLADDSYTINPKRKGEVCHKEEQLRKN